MLSLDDSDYEMLGYGEHRHYEAAAWAITRRREQMRAASLRYSKSPKGLAAIARREANRPPGYFKERYEANKEVTKARVKAWRASLTGEKLERYLKKQSESSKARYAAKKASKR